MDFEKKYLKYKNKYLNLKKKINSGGDGEYDDNTYKLTFTTYFVCDDVKTSHELIVHNWDIELENVRNVEAFDEVLSTILKHKIDQSAKLNTKHDVLIKYVYCHLFKEKNIELVKQIIEKSKEQNMSLIELPKYDDYMMYSTIHEIIMDETVADEYRINSSTELQQLPQLPKMAVRELNTLNDYYDFNKPDEIIALINDIIKYFNIKLNKEIHTHFLNRAVNSQITHA